MRCYKRWKTGFDLFQVFRHFSVEAGSLFQAEFCRHDHYEHDPLLGVLMRQHANACRIAGEVEAFVEGRISRRRAGEMAYPPRDCGLQQSSYGSSAYPLRRTSFTLDFWKPSEGWGRIRRQPTQWGRIPFSNAEVEAAGKIRDKIIAGNEHLKNPSGWTDRHVHATRFWKLQEAAGLERWKNDYKWASQNVHTNYREMRALLRMGEASEDGLLAGPSDSGFTDPAHFSAIALSQAASAFMTCYIDEEHCPIDFTLSCVTVKAMDHMVGEIGNRFFDVQR